MNDSRLDEINVTFGVPQGSVLGPILFTIFINDLPKEVKSNVRLFADDCFVYRSIKNQEDASILQEDINSLQKWADERLMSFNPEKCERLRVTYKRSPLDVSYMMQDHNLKQVDTKKYLGVILQKKLSWNNHVQKIYTKVSNTHTQAKHGKLSSKNRREMLHNTCPPTVEYSSTVWDPYTPKNINKLEMIQRRAARFVNGSWFASPSIMIADLGWESLAERRAKVKVAMTYKIMNGLVDPPKTKFTESTCTNIRSKAQFLISNCRFNAYKYSLFPSAARLWIHVPVEIRSQLSITSFRS